MATAVGTDVFGQPITEEVLMGIPEFANKARKARADVAKEWKNKDGKYDEAMRYVRQLKEKWGTGVSTLSLVYNGTGEPLRFVTSHDWYGHIYQTYPAEIGNGQWGGFLHVKTAGAASGSQGAVVYRGKNRDGEDTDWMVGWDNPWERLRYDNNVYAEIHKAGYFDRIDWNSISNAMVGVGLQHRAEWKGCVAYVKTESETSPIYEAALSLE
ncbi:hypothetical protein CRYUN_Cryun21dG0113200 [Craigia yunnanensis]